MRRNSEATDREPGPPAGRPHRTSVRRGFTLAELLVLVGLLVILLGLLLPGISQARSSARNTQALLDARNTGMLLIDHASSVDDNIPQGRLLPSESDTEMTPAALAAARWWMGVPEMMTAEGRLDLRFAKDERHALLGSPKYLLTVPAAAADAEFDPEASYTSDLWSIPSARRRFSEVRRPSGKMMLYEVRPGNDEFTQTWCCISYDVRGALVRFDGSGLVARVIDFEDHRRFDGLLYRGVPVVSTWFGLKGVDSLIGDP